MKGVPPRDIGRISGESFIYLGAGAAVLLQMAHPAVGAGVAEHSATMKRPLDRLRNTMAFIYAATLGDDADRRAMARFVNRAHGPVRSARYDAFDPALQLWVAATLYRGGTELAELFYGPLPANVAEDLYRKSAVYGTMLQMPAALWPADRAAFDGYWDAMLAQLQVEPPVRRYADQLLAGGAVPWWLRGLMPLQRFFTRALLPAPVRAAFGLAWSARDERRWQRFLRWGPALYWRIPAFLRHLPARIVLADLRRRAPAAS